MGLLPWTAGVQAQRMTFDGRDLMRLTPRQRRDLVGRDIAMVFQEPMSSLNPCFTVGWQIDEALATHLKLDRRARRARVVQLLEQVGIPDAARRTSAFPHQLSGGMNQRVMIAMALACRPRLLIADEPTTALDVTIQAQILELLTQLRREHGMALVLITHDLGVVAEVADEVAVMYAGRIVEQAPVGALFEAPQHPYTVGLLGSIPRLDVEQPRLAAIDGQVPSPLAPPAGCRFAPRCPFADAHCRALEPALLEIGASHRAACWKAPLDPLRLERERIAAAAAAALAATVAAREVAANAGARTGTQEARA